MSLAAAREAYARHFADWGELDARLAEYNLEEKKVGQGLAQSSQVGLRYHEAFAAGELQRLLRAKHGSELFADLRRAEPAAAVNSTQTEYAPIRPEPRHQTEPIKLAEVPLRPVAVGQDCGDEQ